MAFYKVRPFGFVRESMLFGGIVAQQHNLNSKPGTRAKSWIDFFPVEVKSESRTTLSPDAAIEMFKLYNTSRGYDAYGRKR